MSITQQTTWQEKAKILMETQKGKLYEKQGMSNFTEWLNSLEGRGNSRSNLIAIKMAGEFYLKVKGSTKVEDVLNCKVQDFKILNLFKKDYSELKNNKKLIDKMDKGTLKRSDVQNTSSNQETILNELKKELSKNKNALKLLCKLEKTL